MHVVVALGIIVEDHAARIVPLLIVNTGIGKVWPVGARSQLIDGNESGLNDRNIRAAIGIVRVGVFADLEPIRDIIAIGISVQRI